MFLNLTHLNQLRHFVILKQVQKIIEHFIAVRKNQGPSIIIQERFCSKITVNKILKRNSIKINFQVGYKIDSKETHFRRLCGKGRKLKLDIRRRIHSDHFRREELRRTIRGPSRGRGSLQRATSNASRSYVHQIEQTKFGLVFDLSNLWHQSQVEYHAVDVDVQRPEKLRHVTTVSTLHGRRPF